jgi:hypothetical protein
MLGKPEEKGLLGIANCMSENTIKMALREL